MRTLVAALAVLALTFVGAPQFTFAQEKLADQPAPANAPRDAVKATLLETPEQFRGILGKWAYNEHPKFVSTFEIKNVSESGIASNLDFKVGGRPVDTKATIVEDGNKRMTVVIPVNAGTWTLNWNRRYPDILDGKIVFGGGEVNGKFHRE